jgi:anti-sigma factor RsiW
MKENLKDILSNLHSETDQQTLLNYLHGKLSAAQQHEVEKKLLDDEFEAEALEGLQNFKDKRNISVLVESLNGDLKNKTAKKKAWREKRNPKLEPWLLLAIVMILALAVIGYIIISLIKK